MAFLVSLVVVGALLPPAIRLLRARAILDHPNARSSHDVPTPRGGGLVIVPVLLGVLLLVGTPAVAFLAVAAMAAVGAWDDLRGLDARVRLLAQLAVGAGAGVALTASGSLSEYPVAVVATAVTLWFVFYVNAFNFMDGINGISATTMIVTGALVSIAVGFAVQPVAGWAAALVGAGLAFLPFNLLRARVFLGDVGSYGVGAAIALLCAYLVVQGGPVWAVAGATAVYTVDVLVTLVRRLVAGEPVLEAHRSHVYQRLTAAGLSHPAVCALVAAISVGVAALIFAATTAEGAAGLAWLVAAAALLALYVASPAVIASSSRPRAEARS